MEWLKTEQTVLILSGNDLVIMHKNIGCHSKQNNYWCRAPSKTVQIFLPGKISPSLSGCQTWNVQANLVFSFHSVVVDFKLCLSPSVGDNPGEMPAPEGVFQVEEQPRADAGFGGSLGHLQQPCQPAAPRVCTAAGLHLHVFHFLER